MKKKTRGRLIIMVLIIVAMIGIGVYEVYISYNNLKVSDYILNSEKIGQDINFVIVSDLYENELGENNIELVMRI